MLTESEGISQAVFQCTRRNVETYLTTASRVSRRKRLQRRPRLSSFSRMYVAEMSNSLHKTTRIRGTSSRLLSLFICLQEEPSNHLRGCSACQFRVVRRLRFPMLNSRLIIMHKSILDVTLLSASVSATSEWSIVWACISLSLILSVFADKFYHRVWHFATRASAPSSLYRWTPGEQSCAVSQRLNLECRVTLDRQDHAEYSSRTAIWKRESVLWKHKTDQPEMHIPDIAMRLLSKDCRTIKLSSGHAEYRALPHIAARRSQLWGSSHPLRQDITWSTFYSCHHETRNTSHRSLAVLGNTDQS